MKISRNPSSKVAYFSKNGEIFSMYSLAAHIAQKAEFCNKKSLLMQDWVFKLGGILPNLTFCYIQHRAGSAHVQCSGKYFTYFESLLKIKLGTQDYESIMVQ